MKDWKVFLSKGCFALRCDHCLHKKRMAKKVCQQRTPHAVNCQRDQESSYKSPLLRPDGVSAGRTAMLWGQGCVTGLSVSVTDHTQNWQLSFVKASFLLAYFLSPFPYFSLSSQILDSGFSQPILLSEEGKPTQTDLLNISWHLAGAKLTSGTQAAVSGFKKKLKMKSLLNSNSTGAANLTVESWALHFTSGSPRPLASAPPIASVLSLIFHTTYSPAVSFLLHLYLFFWTHLEKHHPQINARINLFWSHLQHSWNDEGSCKLRSQLHSGQSSTLQSLPLSVVGPTAPSPCSPQWLSQNVPLSLPPIQPPPHTPQV